MPMDRRAVLGAMTGAITAGAAGANQALAATGDSATLDIVRQCSPLAGASFTSAEQRQMAGTVDAMLDRLRLLRAASLSNDAGPAEIFDPRLPNWSARERQWPDAQTPALPRLPKTGQEIAFAPAWMQAGWIAAGNLTARRLVTLYLERIEKQAARLNCIVTLIADAALAQADQRDAETRNGRSRGPLHGLPYGLKDLVDTRGIVTGWGAEPYRSRVPDRDAAIVTRLSDAGAILLAKTSCGALAYGDLWYGGRTRNPWNVEEGSSGSSAGSAAAVADGLCSFAIGTETMGSIVSPSARCGVVGLRPTFGRVPRTGAMALCWSYDKIGAIARSARDGALVLAAINGPDEADPAAIAMPLPPVPRIVPSAIRLGYRPEWFANGPETNRIALAAARNLGFEMVEVKMPELDLRLLSGLVVAESAAAFEELTLSDQDDLLGWQDDVAWPNSWRAARFEPAIGYIQARRHRRLLMEQFAATMAPVDAILHHNGAAGLTAIGNHTGYPALTLPAGLAPQPTRTGSTPFIESTQVPKGAPMHEVPFNVTLTGHLFEEPLLVAIGELLSSRIGLGGQRP